jgi:hypothetical protein
MTKHFSFLRSTQLHPTIAVVLASEFGLSILNKSKSVIVDGTFSTTECDLVLLTLLGFHEGVAIPCTYLLSNSKEMKTYKAFYEVIFILSFLFIKYYFSQTIKDAAKGIMSPKAVLLDFEEALSDAFVKVFPNASVQRDMFLFVQANVKQAGQLGLKFVVKEIVIDINVLWYAPIKKDFDREVVQFLDKWDKREPSYATYFRNNWLNRFLPETWALFGRPSNALSGLFCRFSIS